MFPHACFPKSFALLLVHFAKTIASHLASFGISHTEDIIGLDSTINTTVTRNWLAEWLDNMFWFWWRYLEECCASLCFSLRLNNLLTSSNKSLSVILLSLQIRFFFSQCLSWSLTSIECVFLRCKNWLLRVKTIRKLF